MNYKISQLETLKVVEVLVIFNIRIWNDWRFSLPPFTFLGNVWLKPSSVVYINGLSHWKCDIWIFKSENLVSVSVLILGTIKKGNI